MLDRRAFALATVLIGLALGLIGNILFYGRGIGLSFPLFILTLVVVTLGLRAAVRQPLRVRVLWLLVPLLFFAAMIAVRDEGAISALNVLAVLALGGLALHYLPLQHAPDEDTLPDYVQAVFASTINIMLMPVVQYIGALMWLRDRRNLQSKPLGAVVRGLLLLLPIMVVFGVLLASADAVFADMVQSVLRLFNFSTSDDVINQGALILVLGWLGCGMLAYAVVRRTVIRSGRRGEEIVYDVPQAEAARAPRAAPAAVHAAVAMPTPVAVGAAGGLTVDLPANGKAVSTDEFETFRAEEIVAEAQANPNPRAAKKHPFTLGMIESAMVLGGVNLMFGLFVVIQFAYFFGGQANLASMTYAEYARRGTRCVLPAHHVHRRASCDAHAVPA
jgi:hypothetical protein